jgi:multicomponent Na+:H+ antiporter subunit B
VGLGLCLAFLILKAPNLAVTQLVVEILCVIILIRGTINRDLALVRDGRWFFNTIATVVFMGCFLAFGFLALKELPAFGAPMTQAPAMIDMATAQVLNLVTALTMHVRSFDRLAETGIFFAAVIAVRAITRKKGTLDDK